MYDTPFHCEIDPCRIGVRTNVRPAKSMVICVRSPYASSLTDYWLECRILRIYTAYYKKVMRESRGKFWEEYKKTPEKRPYATFWGGGAVDGN